MTAHQGSTEQFIVIRKQDIEDLPLDLNFEVESFLDEALMYLPQNNYLVCGADKSYADTVAKIIFEGEQIHQ